MINKKSKFVLFDKKKFRESSLSFLSALIIKVILLLIDFILKKKNFSYTTSIIYLNLYTTITFNFHFLNFCKKNKNSTFFSYKEVLIQIIGLIFIFIIENVEGKRIKKLSLFLIGLQMFQGLIFFIQMNLQSLKPQFKLALIFMITIKSFFEDIWILSHHLLVQFLNQVLFIENSINLQNKELVLLYYLTKISTAIYNLLSVVKNNLFFSRVIFVFIDALIYFMLRL